MEVLPAPGSPAPVKVEKSLTPTFDTLTARQKKFCEEYLACLNATEAAVRAGYAKGDRYKAGQQGHENLRKPDIGTALDELAASRPQVAKRRILDELASVAFADMKDFADWDGTTFTLKGVDDLDPGASRAIKKISRSWGDTDTMAIEFHSKLDALKVLVDFHKMIDKSKEGGGVTVNVQQNNQNNGDTVYVRTPVADRSSWEERMRLAQKEQRDSDNAAIDAAAKKK